MMTKPPNTKNGEEICPICKRPKGKHSSEELRACFRKLEEFRSNPEGGAGIQ